MRRTHQRNVLPMALAISGALHALIVPRLSLSLDGLLATRDTQAPPVRVVALGDSQWAKGFEVKKPNLTPSKPEASAPDKEQRRPAAPEPPPAPPPVEEKLNGQVVEVPPTADDSPNPSAKYLSKYNTHVAKETTARMEKRDRTRRAVTNELATQAPAPPNRPPDAFTPGLTIQGDGKPAQADPSPGEERFVLKIPDILKRESVDLEPIPGTGVGIRDQRASDAISGNSDRFELSLGGKEAKAAKEAGTEGSPEGAAKGERDGKPGIPTLAALVPNFGTLARISGSPSDDYVAGVEEGEGTFLNTKEFKYATFFHRVKHSVSDEWHDLARSEYRRRDPTGNIYGVRDRATLLHVELNGRGELDDISVEQSSGVDFLDSVAIEAFRRAQPFPNPPIGIADADGGIRFNFQFIVTMTPTRGSDVFR
ncbi:MAG: energy transducer TonB [Deltaproteobacteria bacterium]|nr:energy transducer TonB [Deltaproteobacteria bacterium]